MGDLLDAWLDRRLRSGRPLPARVRGLLDEGFLWVAAGQLLLALGVPAATVRRLAVLQGILEELRTLAAAAGRPIPRLDAIRSWADVGRLDRAVTAAGGPAGGTPLEDRMRALVPAPRLAGWIEDGGDVLLELAEEVLAALRRRRIRPEVVGVDGAAAAREARAWRGVLRAAGLRAVATGGEEALDRALGVLDARAERTSRALATRPVAARRGEVRRLVGVVRALPPGTRARLLPVGPLRSRLVLTRVVARALRAYREGEARPGPGDPGHGGRRPA